MKTLFWLILSYSLLILLGSCAESGCPGGMCAPNHYYSSPKSIWSMGGTPNYRHTRGYRTKNMRIRTHYKHFRPVKRIDYRQGFDFSFRPKGGNIESGTFRSGYRMPGRANIEGGVFKSGYRPRKSANIEAMSFKTRGGYRHVANIESGRFGPDRTRYHSANIEQSPFKTRRTAKKRTLAFQKAIRYKEPSKVKKNSEFGLFPPEIEGWEKRDPLYKKRNYKPKKEGHGVKKIKDE